MLPPHSSERKAVESRKGNPEGLGSHGSPESHAQSPRPSVERKNTAKVVGEDDAARAPWRRTRRLPGSRVDSRSVPRRVAFPEGGSDPQILPRSEYGGNRQGP